VCSSDLKRSSSYHNILSPIIIEDEDDKALRAYEELVREREDELRRREEEDRQFALLRARMKYYAVQKKERKKEYEVAVIKDREEDALIKVRGAEGPEEKVDDKPEFNLATIPKTLDSKFSKMDVDDAVKPIILNLAKKWELTRQSTLLSEPQTTTIDVPTQEQERKAAFDLLDALSRSGTLMMDYAQLHVVVASAHCFGENLLNCVVKDNMNPIEKVERTEMIIATTFHEQPVDVLVKPEHLPKLQAYSPSLFQ